MRQKDNRIIDKNKIIDKRADRQTNKQADTHTAHTNRRTNTHSGRQTDRQAQCNTLALNVESISSIRVVSSF